MWYSEASPINVNWKKEGSSLPSTITITVLPVSIRTLLHKMWIANSKSVLLCFTLIVWDFPLSTVLHTKWMQVLPKTSLGLEVKGIKKLCNSQRIWTVRHWKIWMWTYKVAAETGFQKCEAILLLLGLSFRSNTGKATIPEQCYCREMEEGINGRTASQASYNVEKSKNTTRQV